MLEISVPLYLGIYLFSIERFSQYNGIPVTVSLSHFSFCLCNTHPLSNYTTTYIPLCLATSNSCDRKMFFLCHTIQFISAYLSNATTKSHRPSLRSLKRNAAPSNAHYYSIYFTSIPFHSIFAFHFCVPFLVSTAKKARSTATLCKHTIWSLATVRETKESEVFALS